MSFSKAKEFLKDKGLEERIMEFKTSSATVDMAAEAIGCTNGEIAKSLSFVVDEKPILVIVAGDKKIDNPKFKAEFHTKAKMLPFDDVERLIGHAVGGVCPFGINENVDIYLDVSLKKYDTVYPACGSSNSAVKLKLNELEQIIPYNKWVDVCKEL